MSRASVLLALAIVAIGCSSDHRITPPEPTTTTTGVAVGRMHIMGGPPRRDGKTNDQNLPGKVDVFPAVSFRIYPDHSEGFDAEPIRTATAEDGRFRIALDPGTYRLRGDPANSGIQVDFNSEPFTIKAGRTTRVDLVVYAP